MWFQLSLAKPTQMARAILAPVLLSVALAATNETVHDGGWQCPVCGLPYTADDYQTKPLVEFIGGQTIALGGDGAARCVQKFNAAPDNYLAADEDYSSPRPSRAGETLVCPVSGETFDAPKDDAWSGIQFAHGQTIYTCCPGCAGKMKANLTAYISKLPEHHGIFDAGEITVV